MLIKMLHKIVGNHYLASNCTRCLKLWLQFKLIDIAQEMWENNMCVLIEKYFAKIVWRRAIATKFTLACLACLQWKMI